MICEAGPDAAGPDARHDAMNDAYGANAHQARWRERYAS